MAGEEGYRWIDDAHEVVQRLSDGAFIPAADDNGDWIAYQAWVAAGGETEDPE